MATLFPLIDVPEPQETATGDTSRLYREIKWDDQTNRPVWRGGNPVWVTGAAAVKSWILMTLYTVRQSKDIFSPDYGCDPCKPGGTALFRYRPPERGGAPDPRVPGHQSIYYGCAADHLRVFRLHVSISCSVCDSLRGGED